LAQGDVLELGSTASVPARATTLYPTAGGWPRRSDDRTLVLRLDLGSFRILWCNDAGFLAEKAMLETLPPEAVRSDMIIRNQHADDFSLLPEFLDAVRPRVIITSNDTFPPEQALPPRVLDECSKRDITLLDQRQTGAVTLGIWADRVDVTATRAISVPELRPVGTRR
jgi:beta-lactamase superfamily II metal-dependent hydrolase